MKEKRCGFVALIGRPSSGKSTFINTVLDYKVSIVSSHPQTTRSIIRGIYNDDDSQIVFLDTPGYHHFDSSLNKNLSSMAMQNLESGDLILYMIDMSREYGDEEKEILMALKPFEKRVVVVYNKLDIEHPYYENIRDHVENAIVPLATVQISAKKGDNCTEVIKILKEHLPIGPLFYDDDYVTDQSIGFRIKEIVREKVFHFTSEEVPHAVYVDVKELEVSDDTIVARATIFVERDSQKRVLIGKNGDMIKKIGQTARLELEDIMERKVHLFLKVDVHHKWRKKEDVIKKLYDIP